MRKEKQIREHESKQLLDELSKMPDMVIATAYLHAIYYTLYGADVTNAWNTAVQQGNALEKAYVNGYAHGMENTAREFKRELQDYRNKIYRAIEEIRKLDDLNPNYEMDKREYVSKRNVIEILRDIRG